MPTKKHLASYEIKAYFAIILFTDLLAESF